MKKLAKKAIRRNTIVRKKGDTFFARVVRLLPDDKALILCSGLHFCITSVSNLDVSGYRGYSRVKYDENGKRSHFVHMTSLRNLKRMAQKYHFENAFKTPLDYEYIRHDE